MPGSSILFLPETRIEGTVILTDWVEVDMYKELLIFLKITAQGAYTDETLDITVQVKTQDDDAYEIAKFKTIKDKTSDLPYRDVLPITWFGQNIRLKLVIEGSDPDYTVKLQGAVKRT